MTADELTPEEEGALDDEIARVCAILDSERAPLERQLQAEVFGPDEALKTFIGDAKPRPMEQWGEGFEPNESQGEWVGRAQREVFGDEGESDRLDQHEDRLLMLESPDPEPEIIPDQEPWRWARLNAAWSAGSNTVTAHPCVDDLGTDEDTETTLTLYCTLPKGSTPNFVSLADDDIVAYFPFYDNDHSEYRGIIVGASHAGTNATPAVILPSAFENETAQTDTWDRANPAEGKDGLTARLQMRTAYVHDGDEKLYAFYRTFTYDSSGKLAAISAETRVEVDVPEACP